MEISIKEIIDQFRNGDVKAANVLIQTFKNPLQDDVLKIYLIELQKNISALNQAFELISTILKIDLYSKSDAVIEEYQLFLANLVSAHPYYLQSVCQKLVRTLIPEIKGHSVDLADEEKQNCERIFNHVHHTIGIIANLIPLLSQILIPIINSTFPFMKRSLYEQAYYVSNLLKICDYLPSLEQQILEIIIAKLLNMDLSSPKHEIEDAIEKQAKDNEINLVFNLESDLSKTSKMSSPDTIPYDLANTLDVLLEILMKYIHDKCYNNDILNWEVTRQLYKKLFFVFEKIILPAHAASHVQFIMFYICSFKKNIFEEFLERLWKNVQNPYTPMILRQHSVAYMASLVARAKYIDTKTTITLLNLLVSWIHRYIDNQSSSSGAYADVVVHGTFYSVCQAVFYVFAFRYKEFVYNPQGLKYLQSLNFERIINCQLNPLKLCVSSVVNNFAAKTRLYQLVYCYAIIERNKRIMLPVINSNSELTNMNPLDSFFPFDPYLLTRSSRYILHFYQEYEGNVIKEEATVDIEEEDDFLEDKSLKSTHHGSSLYDNIFSYGSSPGFRTILPSTAIY